MDKLTELPERSVREWVGRSADARIPETVKTRVWRRAESCCQRCGVRVSSRGEIDHVKRLKDWRPTAKAPHGNRESNLQHLCQPCHRLKSGDEVTKGAKVERIRKTIGSPLARREPKMKLSKKMDGTVCRWNPETRKYDIEI